MAVISVAIIASEEQVVAGIPRTVALTANVASSIFYTLDGTTPTLFSTIYTSPIVMPTGKLSVTLKVMASNGSLTSPILTETYITNMTLGTNARLPHSATDAAPGQNLPDLYPYGTNPIEPTSTYLSTGDAGITVFDPSKPSVPNGFDGAGNPTGFTNEPYDITNYSIKYSTTNAIGESGYGIGNLPANSTVLLPPEVPETTNQNSNTFDPKAFVIYQDASKENPNDPPHINRQFFMLEDPEKARDGNHFLTSGLDAPPVNGSFVNSHYNPRTNQITYYYFDSWSNRWIISTQPYSPNPQVSNGLMPVMSGRNSSRVFEWLPFARRVLF